MAAAHISSAQHSCRYYTCTLWQNMMSSTTLEVYHIPHRHTHHTISLLRTVTRDEVTIYQITESWFNILHSTWHKTGHFWDILPSQSFGLLLKKSSLIQQNQRTREQNDKTTNQRNALSVRTRVRKIPCWCPIPDTISHSYANTDTWGDIIKRQLIVYTLLWPPYRIGQAIIFSPCHFYLSSFFYLFSSPNLSGQRLDVYHTSTHGVALDRI